MPLKQFNTLAFGDTFHTADARGNRTPNVYKKVDGGGQLSSGAVIAIEPTTVVIPIKKRGADAARPVATITSLHPMEQLLVASSEQAAVYVANARVYCKHFRFYGNGEGGAALAIAEYMAYLDGYTLRNWSPK